MSNPNPLLMLAMFYRYAESGFGVRILFDTDRQDWQHQDGGNLLTRKAVARIQNPLKDMEES